MNILVTGGSGQLAKYICQEFADHDILLADIVEPPADRAGVPFRKTDLASFEDCQAAIAECEPEVILALGALPYPTDSNGSQGTPRPGRSSPPFDTTMRVNILGLYYLMTAAVEANVKAVIQTSSIVTVQSYEGGQYPYLPIDDDYPQTPRNSYNYSKIAGELMLEWFTAIHGIQTCCMRPAWNWTPERCQQYAQEVQPTTEWRSYLWHYVDTRDVAWAHRLAFDALDRLSPHDGFLVHAADHSAPEDSRELVEKFRPDILQSSPVYLRGRQSFYSCEKAHNAFGYQARYSWMDWL